MKHCINKLQLQDRGGGRGVVFTLYSSSSPRSPSNAHRQKSGFALSGDRKITDCIRFFGYFWLVFGFLVFKIPKSVSVSVFKNIGYRFGFSVNRPMTSGQPQLRMSAHVVYVLCSCVCIVSA